MEKRGLQDNLKLVSLLGLSTVLAIFVPAAAFSAETGPGQKRLSCESSFSASASKTSGRTSPRTTKTSAGTTRASKGTSRSETGQPFDITKLPSPATAVSDSDPTVVVSNETGSILTARENRLELKGKTWFSESRPDNAEAAPQGDPRWIAIVLGGDLAHYFGVSSLSSKVMSVAHTDFIDRQIAELNAKLRALGFDEIPVRFFTSADALESSENYNKRFAEEGLLPISSEPRLYIHDISYHLGTIVVPPSLVKVTRKVTAAQNAFTEYLKREAKLATGEHKETLSDAAVFLADTEAVQADVLLGSLVGSAPVFMHPKTQDFSIVPYEYMMNNLIEEYFADSTDPTLAEILTSRLELTLMYPPPPDVRWELSSRQRYDLLKEHLEKFMAANPKFGFLKPMKQPQAIKLFHEMQMRVQQLNQALNHGS